MTDSVLLLSGGVDSLVLLARECAAGRPPLCLSFDYAQRHWKELAAARMFAKRYGVSHGVVAVDPLPFRNSALTVGRDLPSGVSFDDPAQAATVVPNRNMVLLSMAGAYAAGRGLHRVLFAAHGGDHAVYPDCRAGFVRAVSEAMELACGVRVEAPFLTFDKRAVVRLGRSLEAPLAEAWSCYAGGDSPCGGCGACVERAWAEEIA